MKIDILLRKSALTLVGVFLSALGVSFSIKSTIGSSPTGVCPAVLSPPLGISTGTGAGIQFTLFLVVQIIILGRKFPPFQLLQLVIALLFGYIVDLTSAMLAIFPNTMLWQQILYCVCGILSLAVGIYTVLKVDFLMLPPDAMIKLIAKKLNTEYSKIKIIFDSTLTGIALISSLIIYKKLVHVGIGTVAAAIFIGFTISKLKHFKLLNLLLNKAVGANTK